VSALSPAAASVGSRLSEKSLEINFVREAGAYLRRGFWFGLTQKQEAQLGYDVAVATAGTVYLFQMKASATLRRRGRQFTFDHAQMQRLRDLVAVDRRVFYVLPDLGTIAELEAARWEMLPRTHFLDVTDLPPSIPAATKRDGNLRKAQIHYGTMSGGPWPTLSIHSEEFNVELRASAVVLSEDIPIRARSLNVRGGDPILETFWDLRAHMGRGAYVLVVPDLAATTLVRERDNQADTMAL
jgi:hypothetical protein